MYSCGPTVYAYQHIGNMRAYVLERTLRWKGFDVRHVINITDVGHLTSDADVGDDKLELAARRERRTIWEIAEHYTEAFKADLAKLRVLDPDLWSKATDHIPQMIDFAAQLDRTGWCYKLPSGLYFDTARDADYGKSPGSMSRASSKAPGSRRSKASAARPTSPSGARPTQPTSGRWSGSRHGAGARRGGTWSAR